jgi:hypothetical protein
MKQTVIIILLCCGVAVTGWAAPKQKARRPVSKAKAAPAPTKIKVAEGKYELKQMDRPIERTFEEVWTLYKTDLGFTLHEEWNIGAGQGHPANVIDVSAEFVPGLHPVKLQIGGEAERSLHCALALTEFSCRSMGLEAKLPMNGVYDFFSPSPWTLGSIVRRAKKLPGMVTTVQLVRMAGMTPEGPKLHAFQGEVEYVGDDQIDIGGVKHNASIFELKSAGAIPSMLLWLAPDGIVLALQDSTKAEQRMELTAYKKYGKF